MTVLVYQKYWNVSVQNSYPKTVKIVRPKPKHTASQKFSPWADHTLLQVEITSLGYAEIFITTEFNDAHHQAFSPR